MYDDFRRDLRVIIIIYLFLLYSIVIPDNILYIIRIRPTNILALRYRTGADMHKVQGDGYEKRKFAKYLPTRITQ